MLPHRRDEPEVPESGRILSRQRERWHRGLIAAMWQHRGMLLNPRYGRVGCVAMPFFTFGEMLAPVVEVAGYLITAGGFALHPIRLSVPRLFVLGAWGHRHLPSVW